MHCCNGRLQSKSHFKCLVRCNLIYCFSTATAMKSFRESESEGVRREHEIVTRVNC